jgi:hypothetical protein
MMLYYFLSPVPWPLFPRLRIARFGPWLRLRTSRTQATSTIVPPAFSIFSRALALNLWA